MAPWWTPYRTTHWSKASAWCGYATLRDLFLASLWIWCWAPLDHKISGQAYPAHTCCSLPPPPMLIIHVVSRPASSCLFQKKLCFRKQRRQSHVPDNIISKYLALFLAQKLRTDLMPNGIVSNYLYMLHLRVLIIYLHLISYNTY